MSLSYPLRLAAVFLIWLALFSIVSLLLMAKDSRPALNSDRLTVAATIFPLADIARQIGGDQINVLLIIPPGVSEHTGYLTPQLIKNLQSARLVFQIGHGLDDGLTSRLADSMPQLAVITVDQNIKLSEFTPPENPVVGDQTTAVGADAHSDTGIDPHYWLTVPNAAQITRQITASLSALDPEHASYYQQRSENYLTLLAQLDSKLKAQAAASPHRELFTMHNAWSYFADYYGFDLIATYEPVEGREPSVASLKRLQQLIAQHQLRYFFTEPQKESAAATRFIAEEFGLEIRVLDPVGGLADRDSYLHLMQANLDAITRPSNPNPSS